MSTKGKVVSIFLFPVKGGSEVVVNEAEAVVGKGLRGDQPRHPKRQVTLLSAEAWQRATEQLGAELSPCTRRANLLVMGVDLAQTVGKRVQIGDVLLEVYGETKPCQLMDQQRAGLRSALAPEMRAGVYGAVLEGGKIGVGDSVLMLEPAAV